MKKRVNQAAPGNACRKVQQGEKVEVVPLSLSAPLARRAREAATANTAKPTGPGGRTLRKDTHHRVIDDDGFLAAANLQRRTGGLRYRCGPRKRSANTRVRQSAEFLERRVCTGHICIDARAYRLCVVASGE